MNDTQARTPRHELTFDGVGGDHFEVSPIRARLIMRVLVNSASDVESPRHRAHWFTPRELTVPAIRERHGRET